MKVKTIILTCLQKTLKLLFTLMRDKVYEFVSLYTQMFFGNLRTFVDICMLSNARVHSGFFPQTCAVYCKLSILKNSNLFETIRPLSLVD